MARHKLLRGDAPVRLRVFSYQPYLPETERERLLEAIRREAEALQKIGQHPNLIALKGFFTDPNDPNLSIVVTDWSEMGTLRTLMSDNKLLSLERKLELAYGITAGLKAVHEAEVIHRDVRPENVLIDPEGQPRLMNFDYARLTIPGVQTIGPIKPDPDVPQAYLAPELVNPSLKPTPAADLYGLGVILFEMLAGTPLYDSPEDAQRDNTSAGGPAAFGIADIPERLNELVRLLTKPDPLQRPQSATEVLTELRAIRERPSGTLPDLEPKLEPELSPSPPQEIEPAIFPVGQIIDGKYEVRKVLEAGGSGRVYQVYDSIFDQIFALKVFEDSSLSREFLIKEARSLRAINHPHIVKVENWGKLPQSGRLYLVSEFVEGEDLTHYVTPEQRLPVREAVSLILDLLLALIELHPNVDRVMALRQKMEEGEITEEEYDEFGQLKQEGWLHRDIKPANLMYTKQGLKLIDFNIAGKFSDVDRTFVGTPGYILPDVGMMPWETDHDLFATGIVLYELITGHHPYPERQPNAEDGPTDPCRYVPELRPELAKILLKAVSCDPSIRYYSARRFHNDLLALGEVYLQTVSSTSQDTEFSLEPWEHGKENYNPYVTRFLTLYSQARRDNSGTRGLDKVARLTYVETRLDRLLRPAVLDGQYRLVIITGNAGDGKTAFIQNLEHTVDPDGQSIERPSPNSSIFTYHNIRFTTNYDGSQDEGERRANDQVLAEFFAPFADENFDMTSGESAVHLIAINEGRLIDFFSDGVAAVRFGRLGKLITAFFQPDIYNEALPEWLLIVDLNRRSVVAYDEETETASIFERQLQTLLRSEFWAPCQACTLRGRCFIKYNVDSLADKASGPAMRERLRTLFEIIHLRRQLHITMRDMRSTLSWLLFRDHSCDDVAEFLEEEPSASQHLALLYYNAFDAEGNPPADRADDRLVKLLRQIDPGQVANPALDRILHFQELEGISRLGFEERSSLQTELMEAWHLASGWQANRNSEAALVHRSRHYALRRVAFFEQRGDNWLAMLPYQNLSEFRKVTQQELAEGELAQLRDTMVQAISMAEGARHPELARRFVCLRAGQNSKASIKSFRLFPRENFRLTIPQPQGNNYLEYTPDRIVLTYHAQNPGQHVESAKPAELVVSLDLLELLTQIRDGFTPSPDDISGIYINLVIFRNALAHLRYHRVLLTRDDHQFYELQLDDKARIHLNRWELSTLENESITESQEARQL